MEKRSEWTRNEMVFDSNRRRHNSVVEMSFESLFKDILAKQQCQFLTEKWEWFNPMTSIAIFGVGNEFPFWRIQAWRDWNQNCLSSFFQTIWVKIQHFESEESSRWNWQNHLDLRQRMYGYFKVTLHALSQKLIVWPIRSVTFFWPKMLNFDSFSLKKGTQTVLFWISSRLNSSERKFISGWENANGSHGINAPFIFGEKMTIFFPQNTRE